ncbi:MAG TPA: thioesterase family protein [Nitrospiria bacterium]|nr:thioesterase family protein [Nitrospiria bacterium]HUK55583.1 thioesterase family protein [Nitrospiria bacterium]
MNKVENDKEGWVPTYRGTVFPWHCDHIGHMNVMWFVGKFDEATWQLFSILGITASYIRKQSRGMAGLEQRVSYQRELRAGDVVSIRSGVLEMKEKVIRYVHEMRNDETGERSAMMIVTSVHMDTAKRKSCPFPKEIVEAGRAMIIPFDPLDWGFR